MQNQYKTDTNLKNLVVTANDNLYSLNRRAIFMGQLWPNRDEQSSCLSIPLLKYIDKLIILVLLKQEKC